MIMSKNPFDRVRSFFYNEPSAAETNLASEINVLKVIFQTRPIVNMPKFPFNIDQASHCGLVKELTDAANKNLKKYSLNDRKIEMGVVMGLVGLYCPFIPFSLPIAIAGFLYAGYHFGRREIEYEHHKQALGELVTCCKWVLPSTVGIKDGRISPMLETLAPLMSELQLRDIAPDRKIDTIVEAYKVDSSSKFYQLYGYQQERSMLLLGQRIMGFMGAAAMSLGRMASKAAFGLADESSHDAKP